MEQQYFVTGIGTGVGKTVISALLAERLGADSWKPVQAGDLDHTDADKVKEWSGTTTIIHPEQYRLTHPESPHSAAQKDGLHIKLSDFALPKTEKPLIVEGAGGILVPLNDQDLFIDLIRHLNIPVIVVVYLYLGCINHSLLTVSVLKQAGIPVAGMVFNGYTGNSMDDMIRIIKLQTQLTVIGCVPFEKKLTRPFIQQTAPTLSLPTNVKL